MLLPSVKLIPLSITLGLVLKLRVLCLLIFIETSYTSGIINLVNKSFFEYFQWIRLYV